MKTPQIQVVRTPGLRDFLTSGAAGVATEDLRSATWDFVDTPGVDGSPFGDDLRGVLQTSDAATESIGELWAKLKAVFSPLKEFVVSSEERQVDVAVYWLDVPPADGCSASLTLGSQNTRDLGATVKVGGVGGTGGATLMINREVSIDPTPVPQFASVSAPFTFQHVERRRGGQVTASFVVLSSVDWKRRRWTVGSLPKSQRPISGQIADQPSFDARDVATTMSQKLTEKLGTTWKLELGFKLEQLGLDCSLKLSGTYEETVIMAYKLARGHQYQAVKYDLCPGYWWTLDAGNNRTPAFRKG